MLSCRSWFGFNFFENIARRNIMISIAVVFALLFLSLVHYKAPKHLNAAHAANATYALAISIRVRQLRNNAGQMK
jgi:cytochrome oxidase Cu insertion factor (SCO1/SenC/PrrC family)